MDDSPDLVTAARASAAAAGFEYSSDDRVGRLLAVLAASLPAGARILELGTGTGVGTAWIVSGLTGRSDVEIVTVEAERANAGLAATLPWPPSVQLVVGDAVDQLPVLGTFDLIFADAQGGKWDRLDLTIAALRPGGFLLVDDMTPRDSWDADQRHNQEQVRSTLTAHPDLVCSEMAWATGVILAVRKR